MGPDGSRRNRPGDTGGREPGGGGAWILQLFLSLGRSVVVVDWAELSR